MLSKQQQLIIGTVLIVVAVVALTFARWFMDDFILVGGMLGSYILGRYAR